MLLWRSSLACAVLNFQWWWLLTKDGPCGPKKIHCQKWMPYKARSLLSKSMQRRREMAYPNTAVPTKAILQPSWDTTMLFCTLWVYPSTYPCHTLSADAEHISQGHCQKWCQKLEFSWCEYVPTALKGIKKYTFECFHSNHISCSTQIPLHASLVHNSKLSWNENECTAK